MRRLEWLLTGVTAISVLALFIAVSNHAGPTGAPRPPVATLPTFDVTSYTMTIRPVNNQPDANTFIVTERATLHPLRSVVDETTSTRPPHLAPKHIEVTRRVPSHLVRNGLVPLVRTVHIEPLGARGSGLVIRRMEGQRVRVQLCDLECPEAKIEVMHVRLHSFYQADAADAAEHPFLDTETVTWKRSDDYASGIDFAYVDSRYVPFRPVLNGVLWISSLNELVLASFVCLLTLLWTYGLIPVVSAVDERRFRDRVEEAVSGDPKAAGVEKPAEPSSSAAPTSAPNRTQPQKA